MNNQNRLISNSTLQSVKSIPNSIKSDNSKIDTKSLKSNISAKSKKSVTNQSTPKSSTLIDPSKPMLRNQKKYSKVDYPSLIDYKNDIFLIPFCRLDNNK